MPPPQFNVCVWKTGSCSIYEIILDKVTTTYKIRFAHVGNKGKNRLKEKTVIFRNDFKMIHSIQSQIKVTFVHT